MSTLKELKALADGADALQMRTYDAGYAGGWRKWETIDRTKFDEICYYIEHGWLYYQVRALTASPAMCHKKSPADDCPGLSQEGIANNFVGNPFSFRK